MRATCTLEWFPSGRVLRGIGMHLTYGVFKYLETVLGAIQFQCINSILASGSLLRSRAGAIFGIFLGWLVRGYILCRTVQRATTAFFQRMFFRTSVFLHY